MPAPKKPSPAELRDAAAELNQEAATEEAAEAAASSPAPAKPAEPPALDHATAKPLARRPYRHAKTQQTVYHHQNGWSYTATGCPIAPLTDDEVKAEADAQAAKAKAAAPAPAASTPAAQ